jgi:hypothetical protein
VFKLRARTTEIVALWSNFWLSLTLDPMGKMFQNASSLKPLGQLKPNFPGIINWRSSTKFGFFMLIGIPRWGRVCSNSGQEPQKLWLYDQIFGKEFNLGFHQPNQRLSRACIVHLVMKRTNWSYSIRNCWPSFLSPSIIFTVTLIPVYNVHYHFFSNIQRL